MLPKFRIEEWTTTWYYKHGKTPYL
jgi:hypothetical protein